MDSTDRLAFLAASSGPGGVGQAIVETEAAAASRVGRPGQPTKLPAEMGDRREWEALGFAFGNVVDGIYIEATLPEGWTKDYDPQDPRHMVLMDPTGRKRASMFVKDVFYDRYARMQLLTPDGYVSSLLWGDDDDPTPIVDDWTTAEVLRAAIADARTRQETEIAEYESIGYERGVASGRERLARLAKVEAKLP